MSVAPIEFTVALELRWTATRVSGDECGRRAGVTEWLDSGNQEAWGEGSLAEGQAGLATGSCSSPCALGVLSAWLFQVRIEMVRHEAGSTCHHTCLAFSMGPLTPCLLISAVWPLRYTGLVSAKQQ